MRKIVVVLLLSVTSVMFAQDKSKLSTTLNAGLAFPSGDFGNVYNTGFGGELSIAYNLEWNSQLYASLGYSHWSINNDNLNNNSTAPGIYDVKAPVTALPVLLGVRWFWQQENFAPYLLIEGGIYNYSLEVSGTYTNNGTVTIIRPKDETYRESSFNIGLGGIWQLNDDVDLDIKARYHFVSSSKKYNLGDGAYDAEFNTSKFISLMAGIVFNF